MTTTTGPKSEAQSAMHTILTVDRKRLLDTLRACAPAMSAEETRYYMCGIRCEVNKGTITLIATDGHRLVSGDVAASIVTGPMHPATWERKSILAGIKWLSTTAKNSQKIAISLGSSATFEGENGARCSISHINAVYPDWRRVVPEWSQYDNIATMDRLALCKALKSVIAMPRGQRSPDRIVEHNGHALRLLSNGQATHLERSISTVTRRTEDYRCTVQRGKRRGQTEMRRKWHVADETVATKTTSVSAVAVGTDFLVGVNAVYFYDLVARGGKTVHVAVGDQSGGPIRIDCGDDITRVLMSMRI